MSGKWILAALRFVLLTALLSSFWTAFIYVVLAGVSFLFGNGTAHFEVSGRWALDQRFWAAVVVICLSVALLHAPSVVAVPITSSTASALAPRLVTGTVRDRETGLALAVLGPTAVITDLGVLDGH